jgi:hypothetical protein
MPDLMHRRSKRNQVEFSDSLHPDNVFARLQAQTRRHFLRSLTGGIGSMFLGTLVSSMGADGGKEGAGRLDLTRDPRNPLTVLPPQFAPRAKRIIYLHMAGAPSQLELFDHKPELT